MPLGKVNMRGGGGWGGGGLEGVLEGVGGRGLEVNMRGKGD